MTSQPPLQLLHSTTRGRSLPRTVADARAASPTDDQVNASEDATPDQLVETCLFPSQLLTVEMLRRPLEFAQHPAVGVVDQDDLVRAQQALRDRQRPEGVVGDDPARVADHVGLARAQPKDAVDVEAGVHACHHRHLP